MTITFKRPGCRSPTTWPAASAGRSPTSWRPPCWPTRTAPATRWAPGPFVFKEWIPNDHFTATANPHYWRKGLPYLSQITYKPIPDEAARAEALKSGTIDLMITDTPQIITQFRGNQELLLHRRQHARGRRAGHELRPAQLPGQAVQQPQRPPGRRHGHQPQAVRQGDRRQRAAGEQRPLHRRARPTTRRRRTRRTTRRRRPSWSRRPRSSNGGPISLHLRLDQLAGRHPGRSSTSSRPGSGGLPGEDEDRRSRTRRSTTPWPASTRRWAGASSGRSTPTSTTSSGARPRSARAPCPSTWPATRTPQIETALLAGRAEHREGTSGRPPTRR